MRCIETRTAKSQRRFGERINYNMRCIETLMPCPCLLLAVQINYNMRCIETSDWYDSEGSEHMDKLQHEMY